jgi:hypothetical protein
MPSQYPYRQTIRTNTLEDAAMARDLQQQMSPLLRQIGSALIEATPEWWTEATMRVEVRRSPNGDTGMPHSIWSEQYPHEVVEATDDIFAATRALQQLCERAGQPWSALLFRIEQVGEGWRFGTDFEYLAAPGPPGQT